MIAWDVVRGFWILGVAFYSLLTFINIFKILDFGFGLVDLSFATKMWIATARETKSWLFLFLLTVAFADTRTDRPPHILFVLIDDLGWGDVGFHLPPNTTAAIRRETQTPVMDRLAQEQGMQLNRHYVHHSCTGTRTSLQSGRFPVHVQTSLKNPEDPSSGMPRNLTGLAEHMNGYQKHYVGKWDVGMATPKHTPQGRGYDSSLHYFEHKNDYWTQECMQSVCCQHHHAMRDDDSASKLFDLWDTDRPAFGMVDQGVYEELIFQQRMFDIIDNHATTTTTTSGQEETPLFLFYAPHVAHCPLQVPQSYLDAFDFMDANDESMCQAQTSHIIGPDDKPQHYSCRKQYRAMVKLLDDILGSLVDRLQQHGMWEHTLMVVTSDNGGPVDPRESAATNWPLRGGKYSDWEGGVRATALVSGGYIPSHRRGKVVQKSIHIADWYATLPALAGGDVHSEESKARLDDERVPTVDAVNIWPIILGEFDNDDATLAPRHEIPLSEYALIVGHYKLLWKKDISISGWTSPSYPNSNTKIDEIYHQHMNCSAGCLFNVDTDPGEHVDMASSHPLRVKAMKKRLTELRKGFFENDERGIDACPDGFNDDDKDLLCACWMAVNYYGGFFGPYQEVDIAAQALQSVNEERAMSMVGRL